MPCSSKETKWSGGDGGGGGAGGGGGGGEDTKDAEHFKMVAARFRALMDRRERRLEEAMSDPQTRTDLEAMFPAVLDGDYQTLLAGVRGMEEEDFQNLLSAARKRRREVRIATAPAAVLLLQCCCCCSCSWLLPGWLHVFISSQH